MLANKRGFTLIELLIVVAIIGIISAIAYPAYTNSMYKSRRADAITRLLEIHLAQERYRANNATYATLAQLGTPLGDATTEKGYYSVSLTAGPTAFDYAVTASVVAGGKQAGDSSCQSFIVNQNGPDTGTAAQKACWGQ